MKPENPYDNSIDRSVGAERHEIWQEGFDAAIKWMFETCTEHPNKEYWVPHYAEHRYQCIECMKEVNKC